MTVKEIKEHVLNGEEVSRDEVLQTLLPAELEELCASADAIRQHFCGNDFDLCAVINAKSGKCSEDCKFCAQSSFYHTGTKEYALLNDDDIFNDAAALAAKGVLRYSIVTSGRNLTDAEVDSLCITLRRLVKIKGMSFCASLGLLTYDQLLKLKQAGLTHIHNNLETSRRFFPSVCTSHTIDDKIATLTAARKAGLRLCSGGIFGLGETMEDRVDMALELRKLGVNSVPLNVLNPIPGTPFGENPKLSIEELRRTVALYRFILPKAFLRLAGGRALFADKGRSCLLSGANASITGNMLTTYGISVENDMQIIRELGYTPVLRD